MNVIHQAAELAPFSREACVAIGVFDGIHLGHQQVLRQTITDALQHGATPVAITFDRHPSSIVAPARTVPLIYSLPHKLRIIGSLGIDITLLIRFDQAFSEQPGEPFVRSLARDFGRIHSISVGRNFAFGHQRTGNVALLKNLGQELNFSIHDLAAVALDGKVISSTRIREAIRNGHLAAASQMLGRAYSLASPVVPGDRLGRQLGYPTANLDVTGLVLPPNGVYAVHAHVLGKTFRGVLNVGHRPTLASALPQLRAEAHLFEFSGDLYGKEIEVTFVEKLRDEERFSTLDALKEQIGRDITKARLLFGATVFGEFQK